jgi:FkbM family methyltransferase
MNTVDLTIEFFGQPVTLTLFEGDHVTKVIESSGRFYEQVMLEDLMRRTSPGDLVIDVGAFVGTHTVFLAGIAGLEVVALEPSTESRSLLEINVIQNGLGGKVSIQPIGAGESPGKATLVPGPELNLGMTGLMVGMGDIEVLPLDEIAAGRQVKALKIDVEGMEHEVMLGAIGVIRSSRPLIYVEVSSPRTERALAQLFSDFEYRFAREFNRTPSQLWVPADNLAPGFYPEWILGQSMDHAYALRDSMRTVEALLDESRSHRLDMNESRLQLKRANETLSKFYERTQAATLSNADVLARLEKLEDRIIDLLERLHDPSTRGVEE